MRHISKYVAGLGFLNAQELDCPSSDAFDACQAFNSNVFEECMDACEDSRCQAICLETNMLAMEDCPCASNCPNGCDGCQSMFCGTCVDPEFDDVNYKVCVDKNSGDLDFCLKRCSNDVSCHRSCYNDFESNLEDCPCMKNCPSGCPCEDSSKCERYLQVISDLELDRVNYLIGSEGAFLDQRYYSTPEPRVGSNGYLYKAGHAMLKGQLYLFGGDYDFRRVSILNGCEFIDFEHKLLTNFDAYFGSVAVQNDAEVFLCFRNNPSKTCEVFDGRTSRIEKKESNVGHYRGALGIYENQPIAVGAWSATEGMKVEILGDSAWEFVQDHPETHYSTGVVTVPEGILSVGGYSYATNAAMKAVYLFSNLQWSHVGELNYATRYNTVFALGSKIFSIAGNENPYQSEKFVWDGESVTDNEMVMGHGRQFTRPVVWESEPGQCEDSCQNFCFAP